MHDDNVHFTARFAASGAANWTGAWRGCAVAYLSMATLEGKRGPSMFLARDDPGPNETAKGWTAPAIPAPSWAKDLVIYEIAPRGYTSPNSTGANGWGSGTFNSLKERVPYLASLGITAVWLAGYCEANAHFFSIWSVYATVRPDVIDEAMGTEADLKELVAAFHTAGIKVLLDVVTHGVVHESPLIAENPSWFFHDAYPRGPGEGKWLMVDYNYAVPGFRQWYVSTWVRYCVEFGIDGFRLDGPNGLDTVSEALQIWDEVVAATHAKGKDIVVFSEVSRYHFGEHDTSASHPPDVARQDRRNATSECFQSIMFTCHDSGFDEGPANRYTVRGSRAHLGYHGIFSSYIPVWFGGEELNLDPHFLPALAKGCYSGGGKGGWFYGMQLDIPSQLAASAEKRCMLNDTAKLLAIRKAHSDVVHSDQCAAAVLPAPYTAAPAENPSPEWSPYVRFAPGVKAVVVVPNPSNSTVRAGTVAVPMTQIGMATGKCRVQPLFGAASEVVVDCDTLESPGMTVRVAADGACGGGLEVALITRAGAG